MTNIYAVLKMIRANKRTKFQAIQSFRSPEDVQKPPISAVSLSQNDSKLSKINRL